MGNKDVEVAMTPSVAYGVTEEVAMTPSIVYGVTKFDSTEELMTKNDAYNVVGRDDPKNETMTSHHHAEVTGMIHTHTLLFI